MKLDEMIFVANQANQFRESFKGHCCNSNNDIPSIDYFIDKVCLIMRSDIYNKRFHEKVHERCNKKV